MILKTLFLFCCVLLGLSIDDGSKKQRLFKIGASLLLILIYSSITLVK
jgi:hypothetical protein